MKLIPILALALTILIAGCTNFKVTREYNIVTGSENRTPAGNAGTSTSATIPNVNIVHLTIDADVDSEMTTDQKASFESELAMAKEAAQAQLIEDGKGVIEGIVNRLKKPVTTTTTTTTEQTTPAPAPVVKPPATVEEVEEEVVEEGTTEEGLTEGDVSDKEGYKYKVVKEMQNVMDDTRPFYRLGVIPQDVWGKEILIVGDTDGLEFPISDTSKNADLLGNREVFFFNGTDTSTEPGTFDGKASLFWKKGGSQSVTVYYNGVE